MSSSSTLPALKSKSTLPSIVCFKSVENGKFLSYQTKEIQAQGALHFVDINVTDVRAQFDVIPSIGGDLVHLKSRYNNRFLGRFSPVHDWIAASANEPNEDEINWACTLFKPSFVDSDSRLLHVQSGHYARPMGSNNLIVESKVIDPESADVFTVIDVTFLHNKMPKNVAFKGDNGKYLGPFLSNGTNYLQFIYDNPSDRKVFHEVITSSSDGTVRIKSAYYGQFWRIASDDYIVADVDELVVTDTSSLFRVSVLDVNVIALIDLKNLSVCGRDEKDNLLKSDRNSKSHVLQVADLGP